MARKRVRRTCKQCGKKYTSVFLNKVFCSDRCRIKFHFPKIYSLASCGYCGESFKRSTAKQLYCCKAHYELAKCERQKKARRDQKEAKLV